MTRIIAGVAKGRRLRVPADGTRPTSDRVREAVFSMLAARLDFDGISVLDLYAGSGALGLEALSRGAASAMLVESDRRAAAVLRGNIAALGLPGAHVTEARVARVLRGTSDSPFGLVFSDPPYAVSDVDVTTDLAALTVGDWIADDSLVVVERSSRSPETRWPSGFVDTAARKYGETRIDTAVFQRR